MAFEFRGGRLPNDPEKPRVKLTLAQLPAATYNPPASYDNYSAVPAASWGMDANDRLGDCTCAEVDHAVKALQVAAGNPEVESNEGQVVKLYEDAAGYNPAKPNTDQGAVMQDVRSWWRKNGVLLGSAVDKILLFAEIDIKNENVVKWAVSTFGEVGLGINFPASAMDQFDNGQPWDVVKGAQIEGGHAIALVGYDETYYYVVTWGAVQKVTYAFFEKYVEEGWVQLSQDLVNAHSGLTPAHTTFHQLGEQFQQLTGEPNPVPAPPQPAPSPAPAPAPTPEPAPVPEPPAPAPAPAPEPTPEPAPEPTPAPVDPTPVPEPTPEPAPVPDPLTDFPTQVVLDWLGKTHHEHTKHEAAAAEAISAWMSEHGIA